MQTRVFHTLSGHARRGTLPYMAPELVSDPDHVSEKADVWSLGMVLWEMLCLETPFQTLTPQQIIAGLMVGNLAPEARPLAFPSIHAKMSRGPASAVSAPHHRVFWFVVMHMML